MCECQGNPLARVTLALGLPYVLVNMAFSQCEYNNSFSLRCNQHQWFKPINIGMRELVVQACESVLASLQLALNTRRA